MDRTFFIYRDFEVYSVDEYSWRKERHRHNFFELLFIEFGTGTHILNTNEHQYKSNDVYFLTPGDIHSFRTIEPTRFHCLRFLPGFFSGVGEVSELEKLFYYHNRTQGCLTLESSDQAFFESLILKVVSEAAQHKKRHNELIRHLMSSILQLILRSVTVKKGINSGKNTEDLRVDNILSYIRANITNPHLLKKRIIAERFSVSVNYIGEYVKKHLNVSLREYIEECKMQIIKKRLTQGNRTFSEIGSDLGFIDSSHFNRFIRRNTGKSPSEFRALLNK
ncbi:helix-turn-helix domain-containing protein [Fulvivirga sp. 29W222]|uniref:Helix-turn-helix domain-containing protein n=1 Tax=Fulvivirga marina TaxID=2494733 RepID=A0A937KAC0_9BACT|nr:helix-turn-helix domain-containing protein [Fulvivirga marina]MBL6445081.1 helix-turn-helix domain-containing protein [Fulvivirga marina]